MYPLWRLESLSYRLCRRAVKYQRQGLCPLPHAPSAFSPPTEVGLIHFNFPREGPLFFDLPSDDLAKSMIEKDRRSAIQPHKLCSGSCGHPCHEVFKQAIRLIMAELGEF